MDVPVFVRFLREGQFAKALEKIREENPLPGITSRVCPEIFPDMDLNRGQGHFSVRALERAAFDFGREKFFPKRKISAGKNQIAIIGSGPAGLTAAYFLAKKGYGVTVFEALHLPGGVLCYGIPPFRLPPKVLEAELQYLSSCGVEIVTNTLIGQTVTIEELFQKGFVAVILAVGATTLYPPEIWQETTPYIFSTHSLLLRVNLRENPFLFLKEPLVGVGPRVVLFGEGYDVLDCARMLVRFGRHATVVFSDVEETLCSRPDVIRHAKEEGVQLEGMTKVLKIEERQNLHLHCIKLDFADPQEDGRWKLMPVKGSEYEIEADTVIFSGRRGVTPHISECLKKIRTTKEHAVWIHRPTMMTSLPGVFACGGCIDGRTDIMASMISAKKVADNVEQYLKGKNFKR